MKISQGCFFGHNGHYLAPGILRSVQICFIPVVLNRCCRLGIDPRNFLDFVHAIDRADSGARENIVRYVDSSVVYEAFVQGWPLMPSCFRSSFSCSPTGNFDIIILDRVKMNIALVRHNRSL